MNGKPPIKLGEDEEILFGPIRKASTTNLVVKSEDNPQEATHTSFRTVWITNQRVIIKSGESAITFPNGDVRTILINPPILAGWYTKYAFGEKGQTIGTRPHRFDLFGSQELREVNEMYGETLSTMFSEMFFKGITAQVDVAAEWDSYVQKWLSAGGDKYLAALEKLPLMKPLDQGKVEY